MRGRTNITPEELPAVRRHQANSMRRIPFIGSADDVAGYLAQLSNAGFDGSGMSFVHYADESPIFRDEVLPRLERLGLREPVQKPIKGAA